MGYTKSRHLVCLALKFQIDQSELCWELLSFALIGSFGIYQLNKLDGVVIENTLRELNEAKGLLCWDRCH